VIKSVVYRATEMGRTVTGVRKGWKGLTNMITPTPAKPGSIVNSPAKIRAPLTAAAARAAHFPHQSAKGRRQQGTRAHLHRPIEETCLDENSTTSLHRHRKSRAPSIGCLIAIVATTPSALPRFSPATAFRDWHSENDG